MSKKLDGDDWFFRIVFVLAGLGIVGGCILAVYMATETVRIEIVCYSGGAEIYRTTDADRAMSRGDGSWYIQEHGGGGVLITGSCVSRTFEREASR